MRAALERAFDRLVREPLLLRQAEHRAKGHSADQQARLTRLTRAAHARHTAALELRREEMRGAALALERDACALAITALLVAHGEHHVDAGLPPREAWQRLRDVEASLGQLPDAVQIARDVLAAPDPLAPERQQTDLVALRDAAQATFEWLAAQYEPRTPRQIVTQRRLRIGAVVLVTLLLAATGLAWAQRPPNVARGKSVLVSSQLANTPDPSQVVDGSRRGHFGVHTDRDDPPWIEIDLGAVYHLSRAVIVNRGDGHFDATVPLALQLSVDDQTWKEVAMRQEAFTHWDPWRVRLQGEPARFVRVIKPQAGYIVLNEIEIYGRR
jgi:hypothetical protein